MSCKMCEVLQDNQAVAYYRWKNADIEISGCPEHLGEIFDELNKAQSNMEGSNEE